MPIAVEPVATGGRWDLSPRGVAQMRHQTAQLHTHATLLPEQWKDLDTTLLTLADQYMGGVLDLTSRGLTYTIPSLGIAAAQYNSVGRMDAAVRDMRASAMGQQQRLAINPHLVPLPFCYADYEFDITELEGSQRLGLGLDTAHATEAMRSVTESFEDILFNGTTVGARSGNVVYGYRTHPQRKTGTGTTWSTPANIYTTVLAMFTDMIARRRLGPYALYLNSIQWGEMHAEKGVDVNWNILRWIQESFPTIVSIKPSYAMPDGEAVLAELTSRTVDLAVKMAPTNIPWEAMGGLSQHVRVIGSMTPRIKVDEESLVGVVHYGGL